MKASEYIREARRKNNDVAYREFVERIDFLVLKADKGDGTSKNILDNFVATGMLDLSKNTPIQNP